MYIFIQNKKTGNIIGTIIFDAFGKEKDGRLKSRGHRYGFKCR